MACLCASVKYIFCSSPCEAQQQLTAAILMIDMRSLQCVNRPPLERLLASSLYVRTRLKLYDNIYVCLQQDDQDSSRVRAGELAKGF